MKAEREAKKAAKAAAKATKGKSNKTVGEKVNNNECSFSIYCKL